MRTLTWQAAVCAVGVVAIAHGGASPRDIGLLSALERLRLTGVPAHTDHDEGQLLQQQVDRHLADPEVLRAARRAAAPVVAELSPPVSSAGDYPALRVSTRVILQRPASERYDATIAVSVDGAAWAPFCSIAPGSSCSKNLQQVTRDAATPGLHHLRLQTTILHEDGDREVRELTPLAYAVEGTDSGAQGSRFLARAVSLKARALSPSLPDVPLSEWLSAVRGPGATAEKVYWRAAWCGLGLRSELSESDTKGVCAVATIGIGPPAVAAEAWIHIGEFQWVDGRPEWHREEPTLERVQLRGGRTSWLPSLDALEVYAPLPENAWPAPDISVDPADITLHPSGRDVIVQAIVRNTGDAPAPGVTIDVLAGTRDDRLMLRRFIRDLPANDSVVLKQRVTYPAGYGWLLVHAMPLSEHAPSGEWSPPEDPNRVVAWRAVNPQNAPPGFVKWVAERICNHQCRGF